MARKLIKTAAMAGMCFLATTGLSLATDTTVEGTVTNHLQSGNWMINGIAGDRNEAFIASVQLKDEAHVGGTLSNEVGVVRSVGNLVIGNDNKASIASINLENSRVGGTVTNNVPAVDGSSLPVLNAIDGDGNNASIASIDITAGSSVSGTVANEVTTPVMGAANIVWGDRNTAAIRSIHMENTDVSGKMTNTTENFANNYNVIGFGGGFPGDDNTVLTGSISAKNAKVKGEVSNHIEHMENTVNLVVGDGNKSAIGSVSLE